jgi:hypothetical protein
MSGAPASSVLIHAYEKRLSLLRLGAPSADGPSSSPGEGDNTTDAKMDTGAAQFNKPHTAGVGGAQWDLPPPASTPSAGNADKTAVVSLSVEKAAPNSDPESPLPHSADYSIKISPHVRNQPFLVPGMDPPTLSRGGSLEDHPPAFGTAELPYAGGAQATVVADVPQSGDEKTDANDHEQPLVAKVKCLEAELKEVRAELKEVRAEHRRELDELTQLIRGQNGPAAEMEGPSAEMEGPSADQEGAAEPEAPDKCELARSMFDAVLLIGSRSAEAPVGLAVTIWALLLFLLNSIIQVLFIAIVVQNIATDQTIGPDLIADLMCASGRAMWFPIGHSQVGRTHDGAHRRRYRRVQVLESQRGA